MQYQGFDIIGDVHGCASQLVERLVRMGYTRRGGTGAYFHPDYHAVFVGDLVDRGPEQLETLQLVKAMVDAESASIVMGNHEFNAVAYATEHPRFPGYFLRPHTPKNTNQHRAFLDQLTPSQQSYYVKWFKTLPLWLSLPDLNDSAGVNEHARVVHACWHDASIKAVRAACDGENRINGTEQWIEANDRVSDLYKAVEVLLKGPEIRLKPYGIEEFQDKDGHVRDKARLSWWISHSNQLSDLLQLGNGEALKGEVKPNDPAMSYIYRDKTPAFYGHYWRENEPLHANAYTDYTACVDFSAVVSRKRNHGQPPVTTMTAYRWEGEMTIDADRYIPHGAAYKAPV